MEMDSSVKLIIYFFIIASEVDLMWSHPVSQQYIRKERQVVQPTWLQDSDFFFVDPNVRVTPQNLKETAAIRESIQNAVKSGTFAVDTSQPEMPIPMMDSSQKPQGNQSFWNFPLFDIKQWDFQILNAEQQNAFEKQMRSWWREFLDSSIKFFNLWA